MRKGLTLFEVLIAVTILAVAMAMAMQSMTSSLSMGAVGGAQDDLIEESTRLSRVMSDDLYAAGWFVPSGLALPSARDATPPVASDRNTRYYPYVVAYGSGVDVGSMSYHNIPAAVVDIATTLGNDVLSRLDGNLPGTVADRTAPPSDRADYLASFFARSQSLVFVKAAVEPWSATPRARLGVATSQASRIDFRTTTTTHADWELTNNHANLRVLGGSPWSRDLSGDVNYRLPTNPTSFPPYGVPLTAGRLNLDDLSLQMVWETVDAPVYDPDPITPIPDVNLLVREYVYLVVPSPVGVGRLVRAHLERTPVPAARSALAAVATPGGIQPGDVLGNGSFPITPTPVPVSLVVDSVLSDNVMRIVCETRRSVPDTSLTVNQVRIRLYMAKTYSNDRGLAVSRVADFIVVMRSKNAAIQVQDDEAFVGPVTGGF